MKKVAVLLAFLILVITCQAEIIVEFPLDTDPNWVTEGQWEFGIPTGGGGPQSYDPASGHTGHNVYGYNLSGNYENNIPEYCLTTSVLECTLAVNVTLSFWRWLGVEESIFDHAKVKISNDRANWTEIRANSSVIIADSSWIYCEYDISTFADGEPNVYVRWCMGPTDFSETYAGWNIDDVCLLGDFIDPLFITPDANLFSFGPVGGPFSPDCNSYTLTNKGDSEINWTATVTQSWLDIIPDSGVLAPDDSVVVQVCINSDANILTEGKYNDTVDFINSNSGFSHLIDVRLDVLYDALYVPLHFPTIQSAVDAATNGDTIIVLDGTYMGNGNRDIDFNGKAITLKSEDGSDNCIIDGEDVGNSTGFNFNSGETRKAVVNGFTIRDCDLGFKLYGYSDPTIKNCVITNCFHGIYSPYGAPTVDNCIITNNRSRGINGKLSPTIKNTIISFNGHNGIELFSPGIPKIFNCLVTHNGGNGMYIISESAVINNCTVTQNISRGVSTSNAQITNCIFYANGDNDLSVGFAENSCIGTGNTQGVGNISENPQFVSGPLGDYYLSQIAGGQTSDSNCVDSGSGLSDEHGMNMLTTCTTNILDTGTVDMGYHYPASIPQYPPQNDECFNAISIEEGTTYHGSTEYATGTDISSCSSNDSNDVWYSYTATNDGYHNFSLCGSTFDTTLSIFDSCGGMELACNNDACGLQSKIDLYLTAGNPYNIRIAGNNGETGKYSVTVSKPKCLGDIPGDLTGDCKIGFDDFALMARNWLECNLDPPEACWE